MSTNALRTRWIASRNLGPRALAAARPSRLSEIVLLPASASARPVSPRRRPCAQSTGSPERSRGLARGVQGNDHACGLAMPALHDLSRSSLVGASTLATSVDKDDRRFSARSRATWPADCPTASSPTCGRQSSSRPTAFRQSCCANPAIPSARPGRADPCPPRGARTQAESGSPRSMTRSAVGRQSEWGF